MRFAADQREAALRAEFRRFYEEHAPASYVERCDEEERFPEELYRAAADEGILGLVIPREHGGRGEDAVALAILFQESGRAFPDFANLIVRQALCAMGIARHGREDLRAELLPAFAEGRLHMAFAASEPNAGSDVASLQTTAEPVGDGFVVSGEKIYATGADVGEAMLVFCRLPGTEKRDGMTAVVVPTDAGGVTVERLSTLGVRATGTARVWLSDVVVGADRVVGAVGDGWRVLTAGLDLERLATAAIATGAAGYLIEHVSEHLRKRVQFGAPLSELQAVRHRLADLAMEVDAAELAAFRTARRIVTGVGTHVEASVAKLAGTEAYMRVAHAAVQLEGGYGYTLDKVVQRHFRDAKMYEIGGGASDVQREIIGRGLGL